MNLKEDENANVIVCFCEGMTIRKLLMATKEMNLTNRFLIIGSDGWADRQDVVSEFEQQAVGSISIRIHSPYMHSFDDYYLKLDPFENHRNPWFREFWEDKFHCKMPPDKQQPTTTTTTTTEAAVDSSTLDNDLYTTNPLPTQSPYCTGKKKPMNGRKHL